jgi:hypothetical protein
MLNPLHIPHTLAYSQLAADNNLTPEEVEHAAKAFGNDFESLSAAVTDWESVNLDDLIGE